MNVVGSELGQSCKFILQKTTKVVQMFFGTRVPITLWILMHTLLLVGLCAES